MAGSLGAMNADDEDLSGVLVDQLFRDLGTLTALDAVVPSDVAGSAVLSSLPPQFAVSYDARFTRKFIVAASDVTASLVRGWTAPGCLAAELAVRCLLDQAEITEDIYELDLPEDWRAQVEEVLLEEAESPTLYSDSPGLPEIDVGKLGIEGWFTPFTSGSTVPPYALA